MTIEEECEKHPRCEGCPYVNKCEEGTYGNKKKS